MHLLVYTFTRGSTDATLSRATDTSKPISRETACEEGNRSARHHGEYNTGCAETWKDSAEPGNDCYGDRSAAEECAAP